jgi:hypothetical protein
MVASAARLQQNRAVYSFLELGLLGYEPRLIQMAERQPAATMAILIRIFLALFSLDPNKSVIKIGLFGVKVNV